MPSGVEASGLLSPAGVADGAQALELTEPLLAAMPGDRERASAAYGELRHRLVRLLAFRGCEDPESLADEALDRVARRLAGGRTLMGDPLSYLSGAARLVLKETQRWRERRALAAALPDRSDSEPVPEADLRLACLQKCLDRLTEDQRNLVLRYHAESDPVSGRQQMAQELGIGLNALRIRVHRLRRELEACCRRCCEERSGKR
jgi:DNA-directed RNA polymerase specialized sigma24 family protein